MRETPNHKAVLGDGQAGLRPNNQLLSWLMQQFIALSIPFAWKAIVEGGLGWSEVAGSPLGNIGTQIFNPLAIGILAFVIGISLKTRLFRVDYAGGYVWILPFTILVLGMLWDLWIFRFNWILIIKEFFFWWNPGYDEGPFLRDLISYPALSSLAYSLGVTIQARTMTTRASRTAKGA